MPLILRPQIPAAPDPCRPRSLRPQIPASPDLCGLSDPRSQIPEPRSPIPDLKRSSGVYQRAFPKALAFTEIAGYPARLINAFVPAFIEPR